MYKLKTKPQLVRYNHAAVRFPTKPPWLAAINNGHYKTWPGLNASDAAKYFPESEEMWKGHRQKVKSRLRSTRAIVRAEEEATTSEPPMKEKAVFAVAYDLKDEMNSKNSLTGPPAFQSRPSREINT